MTSFKSINIVFEVGKYHSWPNTLPFQVGYWGADTHTPRSDPSTRSIPNKRGADIKFIRLFWAIIFEIVLDFHWQCWKLLFELTGVSTPKGLKKECRRKFSNLLALCFYLGRNRYGLSVFQLLSLIMKFLTEEVALYIFIGFRKGGHRSWHRSSKFLLASLSLYQLNSNEIVGAVSP